MPITLSRLTLFAPASYCIRVQGALSESWSEHLGMAVEVEQNEACYPVTKLDGWVPDQAALFGILNGLYGLGFPLYSVECESWA